MIYWFKWDCSVEIKQGDSLIVKNHSPHHLVALIRTDDDQKMESTVKSGYTVVFYETKAICGIRAAFDNGKLAEANFKQATGYNAALNFITEMNR